MWFVASIPEDGLGPDFLCKLWDQVSRAPPQEDQTRQIRLQGRQAVMQPPEACPAKRVRFTGLLCWFKDEDRKDTSLAGRLEQAGLSLMRKSCRNQTSVVMLLLPLATGQIRRKTQSDQWCAGFFGSNSGRAASKWSS